MRSVQILNLLGTCESEDGVWTVYRFLLFGVRAAFSSMIIPPKERGRPAAVFSWFLIFFLLTTSGGSGGIEHKVGPIASINQQITTRVMRRVIIF